VCPSAPISKAEPQAHTKRRAFMSDGAHSVPRSIQSRCAPWGAEWRKRSTEVASRGRDEVQSPPGGYRIYAGADPGAAIRGLQCFFAEIRAIGLEFQAVPTRQEASRAGAAKCSVCLALGVPNVIGIFIWDLESHEPRICGAPDGTRAHMLSARFNWVGALARLWRQGLRSTYRGGSAAPITSPLQAFHAAYHDRVSSLIRIELRFSRRRSTCQAKRKALRTGPLRCAKTLGASRSSGRGCQQLPVPRHDYCIDHVDDAVGRDDIRMFDPSAVDLDAR
jgi:hypothetical protein